LLFALLHSPVSCADVITIQRPSRSEMEESKLNTTEQSTTLTAPNSIQRYE